MKKNLFLTMIGLMIANLASADSDTFELLSKTENALPERARCTVAIVERRSSSMAKKIESFNLLQQNFKKTWVEDLSSIETVAPSDNTKAIFFKAAQILPRKDYIDFLMMSCQLVDDGKISKQQLKWGLFPGEKHLREMWIENPPSDSLKDLAHRASSIFAEDKGIKDFLEKVISGQVAIDSIGKDEKAQSATPLAFQKPPTEVKKSDGNASEFLSTGTLIPHERTLDSSATGSFMQKIGEGRILTFALIIGIIISIILIWRWKSKSTS